MAMCSSQAGWLGMLRCSHFIIRWVHSSCASGRPSCCTVEHMLGQGVVYVMGGSHA